MTETTELHEHRLKRLKMRSMRRGIKEMDILLTAYADANLPAMDAAKLDLYDQMLHENDQDLYQWFSRQAPEPARYTAILSVIRDHHGWSGQAG